MTLTIFKENLHRELVKGSLAGRFSEEDALVWMVLLHTHSIRLVPEAFLASNGAPLVFPAVTQRHAAQVIAELWAERKPEPGERGNYTYWYWQYNSQTPYEVFEDIPAPLAKRVLEFRAVLAQDPRVAEIIIEN